VLAAFGRSRSTAAPAIVRQVHHRHAEPLHARTLPRQQVHRVVAAIMPESTSRSESSRMLDPRLALRKFAHDLDCNYCDSDFVRTELTWVDYMRDRADADVHILVSRQSTGGGGARYTLEFIGLRDLAARTDTLLYTSSSDDTPDITRRGLTRVIKLGLVPFVAGTPLASQLDVTMAVRPAADTATPETAEPQHDPWNYWTFSIGLNGFSQGESQQNFRYISGSVTANRTTEDWKINLRLNNSYNESRFEYTIGDQDFKTVSISRSYGASSLIAKSLGPNLSIGGRASSSTSTFGNTSLSLSLAPAIEYNFVPYSESTRRSLTVQYSNGVRYADYREITVFGQEEETRPIHTLAVGYTTRQPWGSFSAGLDGSQYLHDTEKYSAGLSGSTSLRLFRGFSFNISGSYRHVRDQLHIAARDLTEEEILLRQRQLSTAYNYYMNFGISYRFGSIFNNVVNPRFGSSPGGGMVIMM
jgi:hypothetical protein